MAIIDWAAEAKKITSTSGLFDSLGSVLDASPVTKPQEKKQEEEPQVENDLVGYIWYINYDDSQKLSFLGKLIKEIKVKQADGTWIVTQKIQPSKDDLYIVDFTRLLKPAIYNNVLAEFPSKHTKEQLLSMLVKVINDKDTNKLESKFGLFTQFSLRKEPRHCGIFKLPPFSHRNEIASIIDINEAPDYELGGLGYKSEKHGYVQIRAIDGEKMTLGNQPSVECTKYQEFCYVNGDISQKKRSDEVIKQFDREQLVDGVFVPTDEIAIVHNVGYTWHTHPNKNSDGSEPAAWKHNPSIADFNYARSRFEIFQHFLISKLHNKVSFFSFSMQRGLSFTESSISDSEGGYCFQIPYEDFTKDLYSELKEEEK